MLRQWDKSHFEGQLAGAAASGTEFDRGEAGIVWLVRTACKALQRQGSEQTGCYLQLETFLKGQGLKDMSLAHFKGNRFNILFYNGAGVYFLREKIVDFLTTSMAHQINSYKLFGKT